MTLFVSCVLCAGDNVVEIGDFQLGDKDDWLNAVGPFTTIDFTGFRNDTFITDQYADLGVLFLDGDDNIICCDQPSFPEDGSGLDGNAAIALEFATPQRYIAADFPGGLCYRLFDRGELFFESGLLGGGGIGLFGGLVSTRTFDSAVICDPSGNNQVDLDNLHFGFTPLSDLDLDGVVGPSDLVMLLGAWGPCPPHAGPCPWDLDGNLGVNADDLIAMLGAWGKNPGHPADVDLDGVVGPADLIGLLGAWGQCPPPPLSFCPPDLDCDGDVGPSDLIILLGDWSQEKGG